MEDLPTSVVREWGKEIQGMTQEKYGGCGDDNQYDQDGGWGDRR